MPIAVPSGRVQDLGQDAFAMKSCKIHIDVGTLRPFHALPFIAAICSQDETAAIRIVRSGQMPVTDIMTWGSGLDEAFMTPLQLAVSSGKDALVRAIAAEGADLNRFVKLPQHPSLVPLARNMGDGGASIMPSVKVTPVGTAVLMDGSEMLAVLKDLGANLELAMRRKVSPAIGPGGEFSGGEYTALQLALQGRMSGPRSVKTASVEYLVGKGGMDARMRCDTPSIFSITKLAFSGSIAIPIFRTLVAHGLDIKALDAMIPRPVVPRSSSDLPAGGPALREMAGCRPLANLSASLTDSLLGIALEADDQRLLKFFTKELGLSGTSEKVSDLCANLEDLHSLENQKWGDGNHPMFWKSEATGGAEKLDKLTCTHCGIFQAAKRCSRCKKARYCSASCQSKNWSAHKVDCAKP